MKSNDVFRLVVYRAGDRVRLLTDTLRSTTVRADTEERKPKSPSADVRPDFDRSKQPAHR